MMRSAYTEYQEWALQHVAKQLLHEGNLHLLSLPYVSLNLSIKTQTKSTN